MLNLRKLLLPILCVGVFCTCSAFGMQDPIVSAHIDFLLGGQKLDQDLINSTQKALEVCPEKSKTSHKRLIAFAEERMRRRKKALEKYQKQLKQLKRG